MDIRKFSLALCSLLLCGLASCNNSVTSDDIARDSKEFNKLVQGGWIPPVVPADATAIYLVRNIDTNHGALSYRSAQGIVNDPRIIPIFSGEVALPKIGADERYISSELVGAIKSGKASAYYVIRSITIKRHVYFIALSRTDDVVYIWY